MNIVTVKLILLVLKSYVVDIRPQAICKVRISNAANYAIASVKENIPPNNVENKTNQISDISGTSPLQIGNNLDQTLIPGSKDVKTSVKEPESSNGILPSDHPLSETKKNETIKSGHKKGGPPKSETKSEVKKNEVKSHEKAKNEIPRNEITSSELPKEKIRNEKVPIPEKVAGSKDDLEKQKKGSSAAKATDLTSDLTKTEGNGHSTLLGSRLLASENPISADYTLHSPDVDKASLPTEKVLKNEKMTPVVDKLKPEETANGTHTAVLRSEPASSKSLSKDEGLNLAKAPSLPKSPNAITDSSSSKVSGLTENSSSIKSSSSYESIATGYDASFACDMDFYKQWITLNIRCGQALLNVEAAVTASSCTLSNIQVPTAGGVFCVSLCSFPTCEKNIWNYTSSVGIASPIYKGYNLSSFMTSSMLSSMNVNPSNPPYNTNILVTSSSTCSTAFDGSYSRCTCSPQSEIVTTDDQKKIDRIIAMQHGIVPKDSTTTLGTVVTPLAHTVTSVTIGSAGLAAISSSSGATFVGGSSGINAVVSIDFCQFIAALNCLNISGSSTAQTHMAVQMSSFMFMFPFWKAKQSDSHRRLDASDRSSMSGVAVYSRYVGIDEDMLFLATLAGVGCILFGILGLFGLAYLIAGIFMSRTKFLTLFYDKMIGFEILILTLSQYTIGLTATYQIYRSFEMDELTDIKLYAAILSLVFLAIGIIFFGYYIVKQNEEQIKDVGTSTHLEKAVCMRYGALYDEYKFKDRYFFAPKMMLVLLAGCVTGFVGISSAVQVGILLSAHVLFFVYLEIRSPHHSRFVQTTTSFVTIMKIAALVLTFFLISAAGADGFPTELQHGVSLAIVGLNLVVLFMLTVRSLYAFYKKYKRSNQTNCH